MRIRCSISIVPVALAVTLAGTSGCAQQQQSADGRIAQAYVVDACAQQGQLRRTTRAEARRAEKARRRSGISVYCEPKGERGHVPVVLQTMP